MNHLVPYWRFELRRMSRNRMVVVIAVVTPCLLFAINVNQPNGPIGGIPWKLYFLGSMLAFATVTAALNVGPSITGDRAGGWNQQLRVAPVSRYVYVMAKVATAIVLAVVCAVPVGLEGLAFVHLAPSSLAVLAGVLVVGAVPFAGLGMLIGYVTTPHSLQTALWAIIIVLSLLGGLLVPLPGLPAGLHPIVQTLPSYSLAQITRAVVFARPITLRPVTILAGYSAAFLVIVSWRFRRDEARALMAV